MTASIACCGSRSQECPRINSQQEACTDQVEKEQSVPQMISGKPSQNTDPDAVQNPRKQEIVHLEKAVEYFERALVYQPAWVPVLVNLKQVYQQLGRETDLRRINALLPEWQPREEIDVAVQTKSPPPSASNGETHTEDISKVVAVEAGAKAAATTAAGGAGIGAGAAAG